jgi:hypothetical protein
MEMVKVKVQTSPAGTWPITLAAATSKMQEMKVDTRFPFGSIVPLWSRQIPYTMAKFFFFEGVSNILFLFFTFKLPNLSLIIFFFVFFFFSRLLRCSTNTSSPSPRALMERVLNSALPSPRVTSLVSFAPSFLTPLTPWCPCSASPPTRARVLVRLPPNLATATSWSRVSASAFS